MRNVKNHDKVDFCLANFIFKEAIWKWKMYCCVKGRFFHPPAQAAEFYQYWKKLEQERKWKLLPSNYWKNSKYRL